MAITAEPNLRQASSEYRDLAFEDLMNVLDIFDPAATPMMSLCKTEAKLNNTTTEWEVDKYGTPNGALGPGDAYALQSSEIADVTATRRKMGNGGQLFRRGFGSGYIANRVPVLPGSGKGKILASALAKYTVQLKQDIEVALTSFDQTYSADQGGANGGTMAGLRKMIDPNNRYADANSMVPGKPTDLHTAPTEACVTGALADKFNLSLIKTMLSALFDNVQRDREYWCLCNKGLNQAFSGLTDPQAIVGAAGSTPAQERVFSRDQDDETFKQIITVVRTDFGTLKKMLAPLMGTTATDVNGTPTDTRSDRVFQSQPNYGYIIPAEKLAKRWGFPIDTDELGHDGSGVTRMLFTYLTLVVYNPQGFGFMALT